ncbi:acyl-CoA dehydrogenase [Citricoccus sp. SGAir0253]|uniref:acyl-CoA dehydrogenase family protein n=1 Tax=Citricoccus sp. SGAir0253 TaxID=2567881 RepID=UPI0010CCED39|nr:acyl-CoA dehydrogenase family protein [Citricoccus sp. SGAir0253]QCU77199.1 acyl-CoA dehydrogenase [Citricoccus sp. SGAir0253]
MRRRMFETEHEDFRDSVAEFVKRHITPHVEQWAEDKSLPRELWRAAGEQGLLGLEIPEEFGGGYPQDYRFNAVLFEELSKVNFALPSCIGIHADIVPPYLVKLGTREQQERWLPGIADGSTIAAIAMTEPSGGSDLANLRTTAVRDGDDWILNGSKTFITNGYSADFVIVAARTSPEKKARGITLFGVEATMDGFHRGRKLDKVGQPESDTAELFFDTLRVPSENIIGEVDTGFIQMMVNLPQERLCAAVYGLSHARQVLEETLEYTKERRAFGQPIGSFQHNKFLLAELVTKAEVTQSFVDDAVMAHTAGELSAVDAAKAKYWASDVQNEILDHCVQLYGGYGYMNEYRVARAWKDARVNRIWAGSNEIMKELIGRDLGL